jgi:hypothetical protein
VVQAHFQAHQLVGDVADCHEREIRQAAGRKHLNGADIGLGMRFIAALGNGGKAGAMGNARGGEGSGGRDGGGRRRRRAGDTGGGAVPTLSTRVMGLFCFDFPLEIPQVQTVAGTKTLGHNIFRLPVTLDGSRPPYKPPTPSPSLSFFPFIQPTNNQPSTKTHFRNRPT